jgi:Ca2+-binding RTX toxin-like protein
VAGPASEIDCGATSCIGPGSPCVPGAHDGRDRIFGGPGPDSLRGCAGDDTLRGGRNRDSLGGGPGDDELAGGAGRDQLLGGDGNDTFFARDGSRDTIRGSAGTDRARIDLDIVRSIELLF